MFSGLENFRVKTQQCCAESTPFLRGRKDNIVEMFRYCGFFGILGGQNETLLSDVEMFRADRV
jgi:hypothetical protein